MLTARTGETDRVSGLDLGADDYVTKPFSLRELAARVRAVLRRKPGARPTAMSIYRGKHLVADFDAVSVTVDGEPIRLTRREFELLRVWSKTATACCRATACSSASGATSSSSKRDRSTSTSAGCAPSSAPPAIRSKRSSASAIDSWSRSYASRNGDVLIW